ncbi:MAG: MFS transporter, partial [Pseudomonadota bacterium]
LKWRNTGMRIAVNGVWGNLGVASAALITGFLIDHGGWRLAFVLPGALSVAIGLAYAWLRWDSIRTEHAAPSAETKQSGARMSLSTKRSLLRVSCIVFFTTALASIVFQSTTFALPKMFEEQLAGLSQRLADWVDGNTEGHGDVATVIGLLAFLVFAVASSAQLVVGALLDRYGPRPVFMAVAAMQVVFFSLMPGLTDIAALAVALGFMLGAFGQIPINDFMIGKMASGAARARVYGIRYVVAFTALAATLPLIAFVYDRWGFDTLFGVLAVAAFLILSAVAMLPHRLPSAEPSTVAAE